MLLHYFWNHKNPVFAFYHLKKGTNLLIYSSYIKELARISSDALGRIKIFIEAF